MHESTLNLDCEPTTKRRTLSRPRTRPATAHDCERIDALAKTATNQLGFLPMLAIRQFINAGTALVITDGERLLAYAFWRRSAQLQPWTCTIVRLHVHCEHRTRGYGERLLKHIIASRKNTGTRVIQAWTRNDLPAATFWQHQGWTPTLSSIRPNARRTTATLWRRCLNDGVLADLFDAPRVYGARRTATHATARLLPSSARPRP